MSAPGCREILLRNSTMTAISAVSSHPSLGSDMIYLIKNINRIPSAYFEVQNLMFCPVPMWAVAWSHNVHSFDYEMLDNVDYFCLAFG